MKAETRPKPPCQHPNGERFKINGFDSPRVSDRAPLWYCPDCKTTYAVVEREKEEHGTT